VIHIHQFSTLIAMNYYGERRINCSSSYPRKGTAVEQLLRCCTANRKVAGSIPAGVSGFFIDIKSFRSHNGPGVDSASTRNEYQEFFPGGKGGRCLRLTTYHHSVLLSRNLGTLTSWNPLGLARSVRGLLYLLLFLLNPQFV
jgi:hypothetical protein